MVCITRKVRIAMINCQVRNDCNGCPEKYGDSCVLDRPSWHILHRLVRFFRKAVSDQCHVCGYYCLGKGGHGCIDKPNTDISGGGTPSD